MSKRSNRTRGTRKDRYRPDLQARKIMGPRSNPVRGGIEREGIIIEQLVSGACTYEGAATSCLATGTYRVDIRIQNPVASILWEITAGVANIVTPNNQTTDVTTDSGDDVTFTLKVTVTDTEAGIFTSEQEYTHTHFDLDTQNFRVTQAGDQRVTQSGDRRIANG